MPFLSILTSIPSLFIKNINIIKYIAIALVAGIVIWKVYSFYDNYQNLITERDNLTQELSYTKTKLIEAIQTAKHNQEMLEYEKKRNIEVQNELLEKHKKEIAKIMKLTSIKEKTYYEEDGPIAPVLGNTIKRLFTKD